MRSGTRFFPPITKRSAQARCPVNALDNLTLSSDAADPWSACLATLQRDLPAQQFATWIRPLRCEPMEGGLRLVAPNRFVLQWVKDRFGTRIASMLRDRAGSDLSLEFGLAPPAENRGSARAVPPPAEPTAPPIRASTTASPIATPAPPPSRAAAATRRPETSSLNPARGGERQFVGLADDEILEGIALV